MPELSDLPADFSPALRALLVAELAAGNALRSIGGGFPAPPVGCLVTLAAALCTALPAGLQRRERQSSLCSSEITDAAGVCYVLEPPQPAAWPDPDAIRTASELPPAHPAAPAPAGRLVVDRRGELLTWHEGDRLTTVICAGDSPARLVGRTLTDWWDPQRRSSTPLSPAERQAVLQRIVTACRAQGGFSAELDDSGAT